MKNVFLWFYFWWKTSFFFYGPFAASPQSSTTNASSVHHADSRGSLVSTDSGNSLLDKSSDRTNSLEKVGHHLWHGSSLGTFVVVLDEIKMSQWHRGMLTSLLKSQTNMIRIGIDNKGWLIRRIKYLLVVEILALFELWKRYSLQHRKHFSRLIKT